LNAKQAIAQGASLYLTYRYPVSADISELDWMLFKRLAASEQRQ
jgi:hypothetical protein